MNISKGGKTVEEKDLHSLMKEAHEAKLLKMFLADKLTDYRDIKHDEVETICFMFGITKGDGIK